MKAAVLEKLRRPLSIRDSQVPELLDDEVLVETKFCGICGTDLHIIEGRGYVPKLPHILGHEPSGIVREVGRSVKSPRPGDRVVPYLFMTCGSCWYCRSGRDSMCSQLRGIIGVTVNGGFAQYFKAPAGNLFPLPESVPLDLGALAADAVITSVHAVYDRGNVGSSTSAAVIGAGGVGQVIIQLLKEIGLRTAAVSRSEAKLAVARGLGAAEAWKGGDPQMAALSRGFAPDGVDVVFDCVGSAESMMDAVTMVKRCGRIVIVGEEEVRFPASSTEIAQRELEVVGSRNGSLSNMETALRLLGLGVVRPFISDRFALEQVNEALETVRRGASGRVVLELG